MRVKVCDNCKQYQSGVCQRYKKAPPPAFAARCQYFEVIENYTPPPAPVVRDCSACSNANEGYCLQGNHPDFLYNFVKIKPGIRCPLED